MRLQNLQRDGERAEDVKVVKGVQERPLSVEDGDLVSLVGPDVGDSEESRLGEGNDLVAHPCHDPGRTPALSLV
jgi:hypothetical protein